MAHTAVYGIYSTRQDAEMAIDAMRAAGFRAGDISVLFPDNEGTKDIGHEKHTKAPEKATAGAAIAGIAGGALVGSPASGRLRSRELAHSSQQDPSWPRLRVSVPEASLAD